MKPTLKVGRQYWINGWSLTYSHATLFRHYFTNELGIVWVPKREFNKTAILVIDN